MHAVQQDIGLELVHSQPIVSPDKFAQVFEDNPEKLLVNIRPLKSAEVDEKLMNYPTYAPIIFDKWGGKFIGWIKTGALEVSLDAAYQPAVANMVVNGPPGPPPIRPQTKPPEFPAST